MTDPRIADLTLQEKASLTAGYDVWTLPGIERIGLPPLRVTDGPNGARGASIFGGGVASICMPCGSALGATFDPELIERVGAVLGRETRQKRARVLLAPTINLVRSPLYGRSFECYSEDPWLAGRIAAAFVTGVQSQGVATTPKHLVGNETEFERQTINSIIDERTLHEVYLAPFEWAIRHGGALGIMTSYNRVNGAYLNEEPTILNDLLRQEWGFEGFVVTDWFAAGSTVASLEAGLDVQMPGPDRFFGAPVAAAVEAGEVDVAYLDAVVSRRLHVHDALDAWEDETALDEVGVEDPADRAVALEAAIASTVLLTNDGVLPLADDVASVALIGPNAVIGHIMGGGSAQLTAHRRTSPAAAMGERLGSRLSVEPGCVIDKNVAAIRPDDGLLVEYFASTDWSGSVVAESRLKSGRSLWTGEPAPGLGIDPFSARFSGNLTARVAGTHVFTLIQVGAGRVLIDGHVVIDGITEAPARGEAFFGLGSVEMRAEVELDLGQTIEVVVEYVAGPGTNVRGLAIGHKAPIPEDLVERAIATAQAAEVAVVVVGTSNEWETEGNDRDSLELPGDQVDLIEAVCAVNENTVVVVNAGAPVLMDWADKPAAVLQCWLGGQEMSPALDLVLFGDAEPGGRLPVTVPIAIEHTPAYGNFPGESNDTRYGEGLLIGHRWYDARKLPVRFGFGHGLSYTTFEWGAPTVIPTGDTSCTVEIEVTNTGDRAGSDVVQIYVEPAVGKLMRPRRELAGASKVHLESGASETVAIELPARAFAHWDPKNSDHIVAREKLGGGFGQDGASDGEWPQPGWYITGGDYGICVARSITDIVYRDTFSVVADLGPLGSGDSLP